MRKEKYTLHRLKQAKRGLKRHLNSSRRKRRHGLLVMQLPQLEIRPDSTITHLIHSLEKFTGNGRVQTPVRVGRAVTLRLPKHFSLSRCATESFGFLAALISTLDTVPASVLLLDYEDCEEIDLDASVCMDVILRVFIRRYNLLRGTHRKKAKVCSIEYVKMTREPVRKFCWSVGIAQSIHGYNLQFPDTLRCSLETGRQGSKCEALIAETSTKLFDHLEACLDRFNKQLTPEDAARFGSIIGEVLANAGQHSSLPPNYAIAHFIEHNANDPNDHFGRFQIVIFNFGQTIYERLKDPIACLTQKKLWPEMNNLSQHFTKRRYMGLLEAEYKEETLWTLYALQDGVSSLRDSSDPESGRGSGSTRFITDFLELRSRAPDKNSILTLMSGQTRIHLNGDYAIKDKVNSHGDKHKVIAFNTKNDLREPPDPKVVTFVPPYFPGTLLYADIYLTEEHFQSA